MARQDLAIYDLLSGRSKGIAPATTRAALAGIEPAYRALTAARNALYNRGILRAQPLGRPTVSVGNLTTGGTGKTPVVAWLAKALRETGRRPGVLLRGYKALHGTSDEADELRERLGPVVPVQVDADRVRGAAELLKRWPEVDVLLLDDAFQHRRAARDVDVVVVDATNPFGFDHVLPRGLLREAVLPALQRATVVVLTKCDLVREPIVDDIERRLHAARPTLPIVRTSHRLSRVRFADGGWQPAAWLKGRSVAAFCGIGNPTSFRTLLERASAQIVSWQVFGDHHPYTRIDLEKLERLMQEAQCHALLTTAKDAARLRPLGRMPEELTVVDLALDFEADGEAKLMKVVMESIAFDPMIKLEGVTP